MIKGGAYGKVYNYKCNLVSCSDFEAVFTTKTKPEHAIRIKPRYVGSKIGSKDCDTPDGPATICAFEFDGQYVALAFFVENKKNIKIIPHEH